MVDMVKHEATVTRGKAVVKIGCPITPTMGNAVAIRVGEPGQSEGKKIVTPDHLKEKVALRSGFAAILGVGEGTLDMQGNVVEPPCAVDDIVVVPPTVGVRVQLGERIFYIVPFQHVLGVVE